MDRSLARFCALSLTVPIAAGLGACSRPGETPTANAAATNTAQAAPEEGYAERIRSLPGNQRNGVFLRAIRDGNQPCQDVTEEYEIAAIEGKPAWAVMCDRTTAWVITITPDGTAVVTKASPASRLPPKGA